jgi:L-rhamnose mutarotase
VVARYGLRYRVREGCAEEYRRVHTAVDAELVLACRQAGIRNYSIYLHGHDVFSYLECDDIAAATKYLAEHAAELEWQRKHGHLLEPVDGGEYALLDEIFHAD